MAELSLLSYSAAFNAGIFHQDQSPCRPPKEYQAPVSGHGKRREIQRSSALHPEDSWQSMNFLSDCNQPARPVPMVKKPALIEVQDEYTDPMLFSFGITEHCTIHEKNMKFLISGSNMAHENILNISLLSDHVGFHTMAIEMCPWPQMPVYDEFSLYETGRDDMEHLMHLKTQFFSPKPHVEFFGSHTSIITVHPNGRLMFTGSGAEMKDILSIFAEFYPSNKWTNGSKQSSVVPYFNWSGRRHARATTRGSSLKVQTETVTPLKRIKLEPPPKNKQSRKTGQERNLYRKNYFHACESLLSVVLDKNRGRIAILSLMRSGPEITQLLTKFSAGIAGTGLAVLFSVACKVTSGRVPFCATRLLNAGFGIGLFWLSLAVNGLRGTILHTGKNASRLKLKEEEEVVVKLERSVNEVLFRAAALMAVAVLRFV